MTSIAITGARGRIGRKVLPRLSEYDITAIDIDPLEDSRFRDCERVQLDITTDTERLQEAFSGCQAVIHLAARSSSGEEWNRLLGPNIDGTYNIFEAAHAAGVSRVIFASSNHAIHMPNTTAPDRTNSMVQTPTVVDDPMAPTGPYGVSKLAGEAIGAFTAARFGIEVVNLRIGSFLTDEQLAEYQDEDADVARYHRAMFLSIPDGTHGLRRAVEADLPENPLTVNLTSRNAERTLPITESMRSLGYRPQDDSAEILTEISE